MLTITVLGVEMFNEETQEFFTDGDVVIELEHSLASLSKWESTFEKPFLGDEDKGPEELLGYVKAMTLTPGVPEEVFSRLSEQNFLDINAYINAKRTATWFTEHPGAPKTREKMTAELIYYWMTVFNIPFTCEQWHLNQLFALIRIANIKQSKPKKMGRAEQMAQQREINERRKAQLKTTG